MHNQTISLNGTWQLREDILTPPQSHVAEFTTEPDGWIDQPVPGDIHQGLISAGRIKEPLLGLNSYDCEWTQEHAWWFRTQFDAPDGWQDADRIELVMQMLDCNAHIYVNGQYVASHPTAFRPFVQDIKSFLRDGENVLLVRLTAGVEHVTEADMLSCDGVMPSTEKGNGRPDRGDARRLFVRKPQYSWGWDWSPKVPTTAIAGDVTLHVLHKARIADVHMQADVDDEMAHVTATVTVDQLHYYKTLAGTVSLRLQDEAGHTWQASRTALLCSGLNYVQFELDVDEPQLWWPSGLGAQHLYTIAATVSVDGVEVDATMKSWGMRTVDLDTSDTFAFIINGKKVYAKGANWIPADAIYARISDERYDALVKSAKEANFNMLRIWGGGLYERDAFYEACDRYGIMLWHDFMYGCSPYPDHLIGFREEARREAEYQTRRLRHHPSIVLWCGNNENHWAFADWWKERSQGGAQIYNYILPEVVKQNCPDVPYWNSSPYGGERPNAYDVGDCHYWGEGMMNADMEVRITPEIYDACTARFVSEYGYVGAPDGATVREYLDGAPFDRQGKVWQHHNNAFEKNTVDAGIRKHYADPENLVPEAYLLYSGITQGLMYGYSLDSMRTSEKCGGNLFWMFEDCWGEVGWTIVDYALRRKPSWYYVKRAYAPVRLILRSDGADNIKVIASNDTQESIELPIVMGYTTFDGSNEDNQTVTVSLPAMSRGVVVSMPKGGVDAHQGVWYAYAAGREDVPLALFRADDFRRLNVPESVVDTRVVHQDEHRLTLRVTASTFAHAVHFDLPAGVTPSDCYFDLLPSMSREVTFTVAGGVAADQITVKCVNQDGIFDNKE